MTAARERRERLVAGLASVAFTASIGALFLRPLQVPGTPVGAEEAVEVVFVDRAPPRQARRVPRAHPRGATAHRRPLVASPAAASPHEAPPQAPMATGAGRLDDTLAIPDDGDLFQSSAERLANRPAPTFEAHADRLHVTMKTPMTAERVLEEAGQALGLWPPGYTDDPCPGIDRLADYYRAHPPTRSDLLDEALDLERRCRKASPT